MLSIYEEHNKWMCCRYRPGAMKIWDALARILKTMLERGSNKRSRCSNVMNILKINQKWMKILNLTQREKKRAGYRVHFGSILHFASIWIFWWWCFIRQHIQDKLLWINFWCICRCKSPWSIHTLRLWLWFAFKWNYWKFCVAISQMAWSHAWRSTKGNHYRSRFGNDKSYLDCHAEHMLSILPWHMLDKLPKKLAGNAIHKEFFWRV